MLRRRRRGKRTKKSVKIRWTDRGKGEGHVKVEKAVRKRLNTQHRDPTRVDTSKVEVDIIPTMKQKPGVEVRPPRHRPNESLMPETRRWVAGLKPGMAYILQVNMVLDDWNSQDYPYQIAKESWVQRSNPPNEGSEMIATKGAMVIYIGPQRFDECSLDGKIIREVKHLFIIGAGQYIVLDLNVLKPL